MQNDSSQPTVQQMYDLLDEFDAAGAYPDGVAPVSKHITGLAFFPGGAGLWTDPPEKPVPLTSELPVGKIMVIGHNFDSVCNFKKSLKHRSEYVNKGAWGNIRKLLKQCDVPLESCFFTNAYMGLNEGDSMDEFLGALNPDFVYRCRAFLLKQIQAQQPRLILTLGKEVPPVIAPIAHELTEAWSGALNLQEIDRRDRALVREVRFPGIGHPATIIALTHPAMRHLNVGRRYYNGEKGKDAETALVREGWRLAQADASA